MILEIMIDGTVHTGQVSKRKKRKKKANDHPYSGGLEMKGASFLVTKRNNFGFDFRILHSDLRNHFMRIVIASKILHL